VSTIRKNHEGVPEEVDEGAFSCSSFTDFFSRINSRQIALQAIELQPRTAELDNTCLKLKRHSVFTLPLKRW
jgi:hypothetical protein